MPPPFALLPGERVRWTGRPAGGLLFVSSDLFAVPFSFLWCAMALGIFTQGSRSPTGAPFPFALIPVLFVAIGLFVAVGRFPLDMWLRARTSYVVTDRRVLIDRTAPFGQSTVLMLDQLPDLRLKPGRGGRGTIAFGETGSMFGGRGFGSWLPSLGPTPQLLAIDDAASVYALIQRLIADRP